MSYDLFAIRNPLVPVFIGVFVLMFLFFAEKDVTRIVMLC
jgi:hypothetical protein